MLYCEIKIELLFLATDLANALIDMAWPLSVMFKEDFKAILDLLLNNMAKITQEITRKRSRTALSLSVCQSVIWNRLSARIGCEFR